MTSKEALSFIDATVRSIYPQDFEFRQQAEERLNQLPMPHGALGNLMELAVDLAGMTCSMHPPVARKKVVVMVADHGVSVEGVSRYPVEATAQMVHAFARGDAAINILAGQVGAEVCIVDVGCRDDFVDLVREGKVIAKKIGLGTANMAYGPAMTRTHAVMAVEAGIEVAKALASEVDVFATGDMGVGSTTPSIAIAAVFTGKKVAELIGGGTGIDDTIRHNKIAVIEKGLARNKPNAKDGLDVLAKVGGFEIGAIAGLIIGAASLRKPVVVDGLTSTAGAMIACKLEPFVRDYLICAHRGSEPGHWALLEQLKRRPLLDLNLRLGQGAGAALALPMVDAAAAMLSGGATVR